METKITKSQGGRPPAEVSEERLNETVKMMLQYSAGPGFIAQTLGISKNSAIALRKKALKRIQDDYSDREELIKSRTMMIMRIESIIARCWDYLDCSQYSKGFTTGNINNLLKALKLMHEVLGAEEKKSGITVNNFSIEQKIVMNILDLSEKDFTEENYERTIRKLTDFYKKTAEVRGSLSPAKELLLTKTI